ARVASVSWAEWVRCRRGPETARRVWPAKKREVESVGTQRALLADRCRGETRHHRIRGRQVVHDRVQSGGRKRSLEGRGAGETTGGVLQARGKSSRIHAGNRWQADRIVFRFLWSGLLRPGRQGTLEIRAAAR